MVTKSEEDYLETVYDMVGEKGYARTNDLAEKLGVQPPSVTEMLQKLDSKDLIVYVKYKGAKLTLEGARIAQNVKETHEAVRGFLETIQVSKETAEKDACKIEHTLDPETAIQLKRFSNFLKSCPKGKPEWIDHFQEFCKTGDHPDKCQDLG